MLALLGLSGQSPVPVPVPVRVLVRVPLPGAESVRVLVLVAVAESEGWWGLLALGWLGGGSCLWGSGLGCWRLWLMR